jgi:phosphoribosyl-ATP pyrophosphohydrolase
MTIPVDYKKEYELVRAQLAQCTTAMREAAFLLRGFFGRDLPGPSLTEIAHKLEAARGQEVTLPVTFDERTRDEMQAKIDALEDALRKSRLDAQNLQDLLEDAYADSRADDWFADVAEFMDEFGQPRAKETLHSVLAVKEQKTRLAWIDEELTELKLAIGHGYTDDVADSIVDTVYTLLGLALEYGIDVRPVWREVHAANMRKERDPNGDKVRKPVGWVGPNITKALQEGGLP